jgi:hypothetical protein
MVGQILSIRLFGSVIALPSVAAGAVVSATAAPSRAAPPEEAQELAAAAAILASTAMDRLPASISNTQRDDFDHQLFYWQDREDQLRDQSGWAKGSLKERAAAAGCAAEGQVTSVLI